MIEELLELGKNSYSPYSHFRVAAIAVMKDGNKITGVNVENAFGRYIPQFCGISCHGNVFQAQSGCI